MATVRLTDSTQEIIVDQANLLFHDDLNEISNASDKLFKNFTMKTYNWWLDSTDEGKLLRTLPEGWFVYLHKPKFQFRGMDKERELILESQLDKPVKLPPYCTGMGYGWDRKKELGESFESNESRKIIINNSAFYNELDILKKAREQLYEDKNRERMAFIQQVRNIMSKCTTVNQLVKAWPAAERLLTDELKKRYNRPNTRTSAKRIKQEIEADTQELNKQFLKKVL